MRKSSAVAAALVLAVSTGPCFSGETKYQKMLISEETVKIASAWVYSDLLRQAYEKGWRYDPSHIESGFKRHFEELKLQLIDQGHTIVPDEVGDPMHRWPGF
jgi:hypothetical protein